jgi:hypothetical protein
MIIRHIAALALMSAMAAPALAAQGSEDWRKVPELSLGQIWNGPELAVKPGDWAVEPELSQLVRELAARRMPIAEAQEHIRQLAESEPEQAEHRLLMLMQGLFDHMNAERSQIMTGISRYAKRQVELADRLRQEASDVDLLRSKPDARREDITARANRLTFEIRLFEERVQSLTYVCEVPTLIEQRLFALSRAISQTLASIKPEAAPQ